LFCKFFNLLNIYSWFSFLKLVSNFEKKTNISNKNFEVASLVDIGCSVAERVASFFFKSLIMICRSNIEKCKKWLEEIVTIYLASRKQDIGIADVGIVEDKFG